MKNVKYSPNQAAKILKRSSRTLRRWNSNGKLVAHRDSGNHPFYLKKDILNFILKQNEYSILTIYWGENLKDVFNQASSKDKLLLTQKEDIDFILDAAISYQLSKLIIEDVSLVNGEAAFELLCVLMKKYNVQVILVNKGKS